MSSRHGNGQGAPSVDWPRDVCFGCGPANPSGLRLQFELSPGGKGYRCEFSPGASFAGPPGHAHGGIIATVPDEAMGKANKLRNRTALTRHLEVDYLHAVPLGQPLVVEGRVLRTKGRAIYNRAELSNAKGKVLARARGKFLTIEVERMFARELKLEQRPSK